MEKREYLLIDDINVLGKFCLHYGALYDHPNNDCLRAVLNVEMIDNNHYFLNPGYRTYDQHFFPCPLSILYVQLNHIEVLKDKENTYINADIVIFSKDFKQRKPIKINLNSQGSGSYVVSPMHLNDIINTINQYVHCDYKIELLNESHFQKNFTIKQLTPKELLHIINSLKFKYYSNDQSRVGKDNRFWYEAVVSNLPENHYLIHLFVDMLSNSGVVDTVFLKGPDIFATYEHSNAYCPSSGRKEIGIDEDKTNQIKDFLKLNILNIIDFKKEQNERLIKR